MYQKILVPLDGSELAENVLPHLEIVAKSGTVKEVILLRAIEPPPSAAGGDYVLTEEEEKKVLLSRKEHAKKYLDRIIEAHRSMRVTFTTRVVLGKPDESIVEMAMKNAVDLIIMATHGRSGVSRWLMGSVAERVVRWSCVPVLIVRPAACVPKI